MSNRDWIVRLHQAGWESEKIAHHLRTRHQTVLDVIACEALEPVVVPVPLTPDRAKEVAARWKPDADDTPKDISSWVREVRRGIVRWKRPEAK